MAFWIAEQTDGPAPRFDNVEESARAPPPPEAAAVRGSNRRGRLDDVEGHPSEVGLVVYVRSDPVPSVGVGSDARSGVGVVILALRRRDRLVAPGPRRRGRDLGFDYAQEFSDLASFVQGVS
jgi:hypothetical protein